MRKPDKAVLGRLLSTNACVDVPGNCGTHYVLDGGALLHRVRWMKGLTYSQIAKQYVTYIARHYGTCVTIVFDGYSSGPSTKDHEHLRRSTKTAATVNIDFDCLACSDQQSFLANEENKGAFLKLLTDQFLSNGHDVQQAPSDADTLIVRVALAAAAGGQHVTVVADDTDVLVLLVYHWIPSMAEVFMKREPRRNYNGATISIPLVRKLVGDAVVRRLLVIHALSGCDTTTAIFGHGKLSAFKKLSGSELGHLCDVVGSAKSSQNEVGNAGCQLLVALYSGNVVEDTLDKMRFTSYMKLCSSSKTAILPEHLPPTQRSAYFHCLRAHMQVVEWQSLSTETLLPSEWGWQLQNKKFVPITTDQQPAPDELLQVIRCRCKTTSNNTCGTNLCSCRRNGLPCLSACSNCHGSECNNCEKASEENDSSSDEQFGNTVHMDEEDLLFGSEETVPEQTVCYGGNCDFLDLSMDTVDDDFLPWIYEETVVTDSSVASS